MKPIARTQDILAESVGDELILYDRVTKKAHRLNATAGFLWRKCDGRHTVPHLAKSLHAEMGLPEDEVLVSLALERLEEQRLVNMVPAVNSVSRRDAIKRLRAVGIATALIPVVVSLAAPSPAAAASGGAGGHDGGGRD